ncbi:hypothetical protein BDW71DRAFT_177411 [Aspergillus fruticulosus]
MAGFFSSLALLFICAIVLVLLSNNLRVSVIKRARHALFFLDPKTPKTLIHEKPFSSYHVGYRTMAGVERSTYVLGVCMTMRFRPSPSASLFEDCILRRYWAWHTVPDSVRTTEYAALPIRGRGRQDPDYPCPLACPHTQHHLQPRDTSGL